VQSGYIALGFYPEYGNVAGLALANSVGVSFEVVVLLLVLRRRWHSSGADSAESALARAVFKTLAASLVMAVAIVSVNAVWQMLGLTERGLLLTVVQIVVETGVGVAVFVGVAWALKMDELRVLLTMVLRRGKVTTT
ncbi:MAG: hypothetical protein H7Y11_14000, partial [Armatimonadetes bacterium]|nr:hypothetical protein [Anaerolineae bacterium]